MIKLSEFRSFFRDIISSYDDESFRSSAAKIKGMPTYASLQYRVSVSITKSQGEELTRSAGCSLNVHEY